MLFNSIEFFIFLAIFFVLYWFVTNKNLRVQNILILVGSYIFYGWWDWRFLSLIILSSFIDYTVGIRLSKTTNTSHRKLLLTTSVVANLGMLGVFKYYNFFIDSLYHLNPSLQAIVGFNTLEIILPVGISFYTFQTLSYTIDVYKRKLPATTDIISFFAFVSFFPQLVAGPIERASNLLPQFFKKRIFDYHQAVDGLKQILWGLFKKIVIADSCAVMVNQIFSNYDNYTGTTLFLGAVLFAFQIYGDFSGYSDIAIGTARLFGFNLMRNFAFPYFSRDIAEFWRRWHISLSTWFRDYLYIPLGGSKGNMLFVIRNTFIIFLVSGFWHGANWTFVIWGALNAIYFLPLVIFKRNRKNLDIVAEDRVLPNLKELLQMGTTFFLTTFAWIFFRAENLSHAYNYIEKMFLNIHVSMGQPIVVFDGILTILLVLFIILEWLGRRDKYAIECIWVKFPKLFRWSFYYAITILIFLFAGTEQQFIYFQF